MDRNRSRDAGAQLRGYRREAGLTQRQLADAAGVSIGVVRDLEQRRTEGLQPDSVRRLAIALRLSRLQAAELAQPAQKVSAAGPGRFQALSLGVLGPLRAWRGVEVPIGGPMQRAILGLLALHPESGLRRTAIIDALWGDDPPETAASMIQAYVRRLRYLLGGGSPDTILVATAGGYRLDAAACDLDLVAFATLASRARVSHASGDLAAACGAYARALELWRGEPLSDVDALRHHPAITRLNQQRAQAVTGYAEVAAAAGWHDRVLVPLQELTGREPLHERAHARLMIALAGSGQQAAALRLYEALRRRLDDQLGILPGAELADAHARVLRQDLHCGSSGNIASVPATAEPARRAPDVTWRAIPRQLPAPVAHFAGRASELAALTGLPGQAGALPEAVVISAIDGMPGVGKTALALQAGHLLADRFPDRQIFVDLHGHASGQRPADPADVLAGLLAADGVDPRYLPADLDGRAAMWRDRLAAQRTLLILDNAASSAQVAPLLPGTAGCLVLVTSRRYLGDLPAAIMEMPLDVLPPADALAMFTGLAPRSASDPDRVSQLVALCGYLPLAITLLATLFTRHRSWTMADLITGTRARLLTVTTENRTVAAAFELSYLDLDPARRRFFRQLGLHPGTDIEPYAAAALADLPLDQAVTHLEGLLGDRLLEEPVTHRYRMHDLIRQYARSLAADQPAEERDQALGRLLDFYQHAAQVADAYLTRYTRGAAARPVTPPAAEPALPDRDRALAWMTAERTSLLACIGDAAARQDHGRVAGLTAAIASHLRSDGPWPLAITLHTAAVNAAQYLGDRCCEVNALNDLGDMRRMTGDYEGAADVLDQARDISRAVGDQLGEATALLNLGIVRQITDDRPAAAAALAQSLDIYRETGERLGEASALLHLGDVRRVIHDYATAADTLEPALQIYRDIGDRSGLEQALQIYRDIGDRSGEANVLCWLADAQRETGDFPGAAHALEQALEIYRRIGSRLGEANALYGLGAVRQATSDIPGTAQVLTQALDIYRDIGDRLGQANVLCLQADALQAAGGDLAGAAELLEQALSIYDDIGNRVGQAEALNRAGTVHLTHGDPQQARSYHLSALKLARAIDNQLEEARALEGIGKCSAKMATGTENCELRQAIEIYRRIGVADASRLAAEMNDSPSASH